MKFAASCVGLLLMAAVVIALGGNQAVAQDNPAPAAPQAGAAQPGPGDQGGGGRGGRGGGRGNFDPAQVREMMAQRMKESLQATDEEWKVIQPRIEKVMELQPMGRMGGFAGGRGGTRGGQGAQPGTPPPPPDGARPPQDGQAGQAGPGGRGGRGGFFGPQTPESEALQKVLESKDSTADQIKAALKAFRDAREKQEQELTKAREELKEVLSVRQEAQLVLMRVLE